MFIETTKNHWKKSREFLINGKTNYIYGFMGKYGLHIVNIATLSKLIEQVHAMSTKIQAVLLFCRIWQSDTKFHTENPGNKSSWNDFGRTKVGALILSDLKTYYKGRLIKNVWCWHDTKKKKFNGERGSWKNSLCYVIQNSLDGS
jgi:hypothetical protein